MSTVFLKYEILVSGLYPLEGDYSKNGFSLIKNQVNQDIVQQSIDAGALYISPYIANCCYQDADGKILYLTFQKEVTIDIDYGTTEEYNFNYTNVYLGNLGLFDEVNELAETITLTTGIKVKFPASLIKVFDKEDSFITMLGEFIPTNAPSLIDPNKQIVHKNIEKLRHRLQFEISSQKIDELKNINDYFNHAISFFYSAYSVLDQNVSLVLLTSSLESLLSLSTYESPKRCESCNQLMHRIRSRVSKNVGLLLLDKDGVIEGRLKKLYDMRSAYLHKGVSLASEQDLLDLQEYMISMLNNATQSTNYYA